MPIYEYACEKCDSEFEVEQRITDSPIKSGPSCKSK
jgi:putative FmdB family regulatory protein